MIVVLHVIDGLGTGGAEHQLTDLLLGSDASRFRHIVCTLRAPGRFAEELREAGIEVMSLDLRGKYSFVNGVVRLRRLARHRQPDVVHTSLFSASVIARCVGRLLRIPVLTTLTDTTYEPEWWIDNPNLRRWKVALLKSLDGITARRWGDHFVALTEAVRDAGVRQLGIPDARITVIARGITIEAGASEPRREEGDPDRLAILSVGRLVSQKGHLYLIRAMPTVLETFPNAHLMIAGDGWLRPRLEAEIAEANLGRAVTLLGERHDVDRLLADTDVFVFPSLHEGFGVALLEAMAAGRACVATDIASIREVTAHGTNALLCPIRAPAELADAIVRLGRDRGFRAALGARAAAWARGQYSMSRSVRGHELLYEELVERSSGTRPERRRPVGRADGDAAASDEPIRTFHILSSLNRRGAEMDAVLLADRLDRSSFEPVLWTIAPARRGRGIIPDRTPVLSWTDDGQPQRRPTRRLLELARVLRKHRPHIVHCHGGKALKYAMLVRPLACAPSYVYANVGSVDFWLSTRRKRLVYGWLFERVDAIVSVGESVRRQVAEMFHPRRPRLTSIVPAVEIAPFDAVTSEVVAAQRARLDLDAADVCMVSVGSLSWEKNPGFLLPLHSGLRATQPQLRLVVVGDGPQRQMLRDEAERLGIAADVRFLGVRDDIPVVLAAADLFVLPSLTEGLPLVLIEAGLAHLPAVAFDVGSNGEVVRDHETGFLVPAGNEELFRARVERLIDDADLRETMGKRAREWCETHFDLSRCVRAHEALFHELARSARVRGARRHLRARTTPASHS